MEQMPRWELAVRVLIGLCAVAEVVLSIAHPSPTTWVSALTVVSVLVILWTRAKATKAAFDEGKWAAHHEVLLSALEAAQRGMTTQEWYESYVTKLREDVK